MWEPWLSIGFIGGNGRGNMASINELIIPQWEIDNIMQQKKIVNFNHAIWSKKQFNQPEPAWLKLALPVFDENQLPITHLKLQWQYRPARRAELIPEMNFMAMYKNRRLFAVDQGQNISHHNAFTDVLPTPPTRIEGCHYHLLHEKHNQETGYPIEKKIEKTDDFFFFSEYFLEQFNCSYTGKIPHPIYSNNGQMELSL